MLGTLAKRRKDTDPEAADTILQQREIVSVKMSELERVEGESVDLIREKNGARGCCFICLLVSPCLHNARGVWLQREIWKVRYRSNKCPPQLWVWCAGRFRGACEGDKISIERLIKLGLKDDDS